jgi:hypothetical protein
MILIYITLGILALLKFRWRTTNYWAMVPENCSKRMLTAKRTSTPTRSSTLSLANPCKRAFNCLDTCVYQMSGESGSWYKPGQTPGSVLGEVSSSLEEMRAETVALYRASVRSSSGEHTLTIKSYSGRKQRNSEHFQGLSHNE